MNFSITRLPARPDGIFGSMVSEDDSVKFSSLEHAFLQADGSFAPAVPVGTYTCKRRLSPKFGYDVFILIDVPGHDFVEIHRGNFNADSDACVLVGSGIAQSDQGQMITNSEKSFDAFMQIQSGVDEFLLVVS